MKGYVKEVWVRFDDGNDYSGNEERFLAILDKAPGDCAVVAYNASLRGCKRLYGHSFDETRLSLLADAFGAENVKYREKEEEKIKGVIWLSDVKRPSRGIMDFSYHYEKEILKILDGRETGDLKKSMGEDFDRLMAEYPQEQDTLIGIYQMLQRRYDRYSRECGSYRKKAHAYSGRKRG